MKNTNKKVVIYNILWYATDFIIAFFAGIALVLVINLLVNKASNEKLRVILYVSLGISILGAILKYIYAMIANKYAKKQYLENQKMVDKFIRENKINDGILYLEQRMKKEIFPKIFLDNKADYVEFLMRNNQNEQARKIVFQSHWLHMSKAISFYRILFYASDMNKDKCNKEYKKLLKANIPYKYMRIAKYVMGLVNNSKTFEKPEDVFFPIVYEIEKKYPITLQAVDCIC